MLVAPQDRVMLEEQETQVLITVLVVVVVHQLSVQTVQPAVDQMAEMELPPQFQVPICTTEEEVVVALVNLEIQQLPMVV